jgi:hypothetical protein
MDSAIGMGSKTRMVGSIAATWRRSMPAASSGASTVRMWTAIVWPSKTWRTGV